MVTTDAFSAAKAQPILYKTMGNRGKNLADLPSFVHVVVDPALHSLSHFPSVERRMLLFPGV